jgi:hypothetical protein
MLFIIVPFLSEAEGGTNPQFASAIQLGVNRIQELLHAWKQDSDLRNSFKVVYVKRGRMLIWLIMLVVPFPKCRLVTGRVCWSGEYQHHTKPISLQKI